jgi:hypothetical protein
VSDLLLARAEVPTWIRAAPPPTEGAGVLLAGASTRLFTVTVLELERIRSARARLAGRVVVTPCRESPKISALTGGVVVLKLENVQRTGSFKERGACNKLLTLS